MPEKKDNFWKRIGSSLTNATLGAAMADSPAAMTASGWSRNPDGSMMQDSQDDAGVKRLRDNLAVLGGVASGITAGGLIGAYGIKPSFRAFMNGLDYTMPSHWTSKFAAKLALPYESAQGIGYAADMLVPATGHFTGAIKDVRKKNEAIENGNQALVDYYRRRGVMNLIGTAADFIVPPMMEGAVGLWRKSRNLRNLSNAGVLGKYGNVADNLAMYHSGSGEGWDALNAMKNTNLKIVDKLKDGVADFVPGANTIRIPRKSHSYLELGPEYAEALMAHEGTHAIFDSWNLPLRSPVSVIGHGYYVPNMSNPQIGAFTPLVKSNRLGSWEASPEEFIAEMGFLRQLTGQNKAYTELSPFYKKRFNKYMSDRFNISKEEASDIMTSISGYYSDGGKLRGLAERLRARRDGAELVNKFKCGGKKYSDGGKFFRTNLQNESPLMYQPMMPINYPIETPLRFRPQPDLGDYQAPASTGMVVDYPVSAPKEAVVEVPAAGYGVSLPVESSVSVLDPRKDAARRIMAVENSKASASGGWDAKTRRWYPHKSIEGGADTIAYGIKLSNGTPEATLALKQGYLTDEQAVSAVDSLVQKYYDAAKRVYDGKYGEGEWDKLSDKSQSILVDYSYNPGLAKFPKLMEGFHSGDLDLIRKNYKRYSGGKELGRNKVLLEELDTLENEYPIFRRDGGSIHIKPSHRGRLTELKARTGKSEAELYNDGNPAHKKMVVFARNARKWKHGDGGPIDRYSPEQIRAAIAKLKETKK